MNRTFAGKLGLGLIDSLSILRDHFSMRHLLIILLWLPSFSFAKTIFEPSLGLGVGSLSDTISGSDSLTTGTQVEATYSALNAGFRYGITRRYIHVTAAVDAYIINVSGLSASNTAGAVDVSGVGTDTQFETNIGIGIGYEWNIPLRTYIIIGSPFSSLEISYFFSDSFLLGFKMTRMAELDLAGADVDVNTFGLALTFPIEFNYPDHWFRKTDWE